DDATDIYRTRQLGPGTDFGLQSLAATSSQIILYPNGVALETVTLTPEINGRMRRVRITQAGQIRIITAW
ncbi:MAG: hypothetical protein OEZ54_11935, partial [Gemmatimonadota bacterium]|nr:hypothetical protein [Gemmatimonadota bacterium]